MIADLPTAVMRKADLIHHLQFIRQRIPHPEELSADTLKYTIRQLCAQQPTSDPNLLDMWTDTVTAFLTYDLAAPTPDEHMSQSHVIGINIGAIRYMEELSRILKPGGFAWVSEYGHTQQDVWPTRVVLNDHDEWSIKFDHLSNVARKLGFEASISTLNDALEIDADAWHVIDADSEGTIFLSIREALVHNPHKYNTSKYSSFRPFYDTPATQDTRLQQLSQEFRIRITPRSFEEEMAIRKTGEIPKESGPSLYRLGDFTDGFYVMKLQKTHTS